jgi:signal transduction histidine kinase
MNRSERESAEARLQHLNLELERRVRERTEALSRANASLALENERRRRIEHHLTRVNAHIRQFDGFISHELRQPLAALLIWIELLESQAERDGPAKQREYLRKARSEIDRMARLIDNELELAKATHGDLPTDNVDLGSLLREVVQEAQPHIREVSAQVEIGPLPAIVGNPLQLRRAFAILIDNALRHRRPNAAPRIDIESRAPEGQDALSEILVRDNGTGIADSDYEKIFDPFRRVDPNGEGGGLNLAICRRIIEHHGGTIRAEGGSHGGAVFRLTLPSTRSGVPEKVDRDPA